MMRTHWVTAYAIAALLAGCASPPLTLYTLAVATPMPPGAGRPSSAETIEVARVDVPDELDNSDILTRAGAILHRSALGRRSARLSTQVTERLTTRLAARWPAALVTNVAPMAAPSWRLVVTLSRFDITTDGEAALAADWLIVPADPAAPVRHGGTSFQISGPVTTDLKVVELQGAALDRLAQAIALTTQ